MNNRWISLALLPVSVVVSSAVPEGFESFFVENERALRISMAGDRLGVDVLADARFEYVQLNAHRSEALSAFRAYLLQQQLTEEGIERLMSDIQQGVSTDTACKVSSKTCLLSPEKDQVAYAYDYESGSLRIFVSPTLIKRAVEDKVYAPTQHHNQGVVNWASMYMSSDFDGNDQLSLSNDTYLALPAGFIELDTQYRSAEHDMTVYTAIYDVAHEDKQLKVGYSQYNMAFNSTDYLNNHAALRGVGLYVGSTQKMLAQKEGAEQRYYYYAPVSGVLEVYRDGRLIHSATVTEGKQFVGYRDLPQGVYVADIQLKSSGEIVFQDRVQIVNNTAYSLATGDWDYVVGLSQLENMDEGTRAPAAEFGDPVMVRGLLNHRISEQWMIGSSLAWTQEAQYMQLGMRYAYDDQINVQGVLGRFDRGDNFGTVRLNVAPWYVDFRKLQLREEQTEYQLANLLYDDHSYTDVGAGVSGQWLGGDGYVRYSYYESSTRPVYGEPTQQSSTVWSAGWSTPLWRGRVSISVDWTHDRSRSEADEVSTIVSYTLPLGKGVSSQFTVQSDQDGFSQYRSYLRVEGQGEQWQTYGSVGQSIDDDKSLGSDLALSGSMKTDKVRGSGYLYLSDASQKSFSASLSGTQVLTADGIQLTHERGKAFMSVNQSVSEDGGLDRQLKANLIQDGKFKGAHSVTKETSLIRVEPYHQLAAVMETSDGRRELQAQSLNDFVYPGAVYRIDVRSLPIETRLLLLDNERDVGAVECRGEGCVSLETVSEDGVYRLNYREGQPFTLYQKNKRCSIQETELLYALLTCQ